MSACTISLKSNSEIAAIYSEAENEETDKANLVFHAIAVKTSRLDEYIDQTLTSDTELIDNIYGYVGTINDAPIGRDIN